MYKPSRQVKVSTLYGDIILLNTGTGEYLSFNETGQLFWQAIISTKNEEDALQFLVERIDASIDTLKASFYNFRENLIKADLIEKI
ncbi:PqqD family protein [Bacillus sonorensis]|uniref:PqqD family protein n=2 Tax=Bacillus sonorensis TaxID=119858 RepID=M5NYX7_9BACI|nr:MULTISPECIES: PqqD family protein [Bacillus]ASB90673.1 hypothetical protein S101395_04171 [Bacillus sonorensis]EME73071.1 hypothetical protein BSONL12_15094 [Bacillus sonorensis L12]MBG9914080.1 hypothetical protein [Bacillus sonorensis]MCF7616690.1 PqqD family protein [Bacillus sonorensis]MCY7857385.1 PqqD family protein [Bacillus sonorensis]